MVQSLTLFALLPLLLWLIPYVLFRLQGRAMPVREYFCTFGLAFIPIMAAAHALKSLLKMTSRIPYWQNALTDPIGIDTARGILGKTLQLAPLPAWREPLITITSFSLILTGIFLSVLVVRKLSRRLTGTNNAQTAVFYLIPTLYGGGFLVALVAWRIS
jgi:hypothetical protein